MKKIYISAVVIVVLVVAGLILAFENDLLPHGKEAIKPAALGMGSGIATAIASNATDEAIYGTMVIPPYNLKTPMPTPPVPSYNILLLGGDQTAARAARGERLDGYQHTDVFVIVHVEMSDPPRATAILVPRNLWVPEKMMLHGTGIEGWGDMWSMQYYGRTGAQGIRAYVGAVFNLNVDAVFYVRMDRFPDLIDKYLGGLSIKVATDKTVHMSGAEVLAYLRDNDNNWGCLEYDCQGRVFRVLDAMKTKVTSLSLIDALNLVYEIAPAISMDVSYSEALQLVKTGTEFIRLDGTVKYVRLWTPEIQRADTPLDVRGMVPTVPLYTWVQTILAH